MASSSALARVVIENVVPCVDAGRYPVKRVVGDEVRVEADIYKDGHDLISARVLYRREREKTWREAPLEYAFNPDRWSGSFVVDEIGRWQLCVEAWPDPLRTWQTELGKRIDAGQDVAGELLEGAALLDRGMERFAKAGRQLVKEAHAKLRDPDLPIAERIRTALSPELLQAAHGPLQAADATRGQVFEIVVDRERAAFAAWYEMFPRSQATEAGRHGTFDDAARRLPELAALGFDVIYLPPIHPIGRAHRKGRNNAVECEPDDVGSPWAIGSDEGGHTSVHPELGTLGDFDRFVARAGELGMEIALDFALQCAPDHPWAKEHPDWFHVRTDGTIRYAENPPKQYQDIYPLNFWCDDREGLWTACRDILRFWIGHGVRTFRVDNPHTKPLAFWEWVIGDIQRDHPDVVFFAEAFTRPKRMHGLAKHGFTQSYTYFTWKNAAWELRELMSDLTEPPVPDFYRGNFFANTPDILHEYLQRGGRPAFRVRLLLAGTLSPLYGIYSGFELCENVAPHPGSEEYLDSEKYQLRPRDWDAPGNIKDDIQRLNRIRREHRALRRVDNFTLLSSNNEEVFAFAKTAADEALIVACNLDPFHPQAAHIELPLAELGLSEHQPFEVEDLLTGQKYAWQGSTNYVALDPEVQAGHVLRVRRGEP